MKKFALILALLVVAMLPSFANAGAFLRFAPVRRDVIVIDRGFDVRFGRFDSRFDRRFDPRFDRRFDSRFDFDRRFDRTFIDINGRLRFVR